LAGLTPARELEDWWGLRDALPSVAMGGLRLLRRTVVVLLLFAPRLGLRRDVLLSRRLGLSRTVLRLARLGLSLKVLLFARLGLCLDVLFSLELLRIF
jgi:hypothetical protein